MKTSVRFTIFFCFLSVQQIFAASAFVDVPLSRQEKAYSCGHNSFRMVMGYWGNRLSMAEIFAYTGYNPTTVKTFQKMVKEKYKDYEFKFVKKDINALKEQLNKGRPVMAGVDAKFLTYLNYDVSAGHFIVIIGYDDDKSEVYIRDPNSDYVESLSYKKLKRAWGGVGYKAFVIYPKSGQRPQGKANHFAASAKERGAKKVPQKPHFINFLIPSIYLVGDMRGYSNNAFKMNEVFPGQPLLYTIRFHGLYYGHLTLEKEPWLGNDKTFRGFGANASFVFGVNRLILHNSETFSPGLYYFGRARTLDTLAFTTIKRIPYVNSPVPAITLSYYSGEKFEDFYDQGSQQIKIRDVKGGRAAARYGLGQILGYASAGVSYSQANLKIKGIKTTANPLAYDITTGPLFFYFQDLSHNFSNFHLNKYSYQHGLNLNLNVFDIPFIRYLGILGLYYQKSFERSRLTGNGLKESVMTSKHKFELPVNLRIFNMVYGYSFQETRERSNQSSNATSRLNMVGIKILLNQWLPKFQIQAGYDYGWETFSYSASGRAHHNISLGLFFGWM